MPEIDEETYNKLKELGMVQEEDDGFGAAEPHKRIKRPMDVPPQPPQAPPSSRKRPIFNKGRAKMRAKYPRKEEDVPPEPPRPAPKPIPRPPMRQPKDPILMSDLLQDTNDPYDDVDFNRMRLILRQVWLNTMISHWILGLCGIIALINMIDIILLQFAFVLLWMLLMLILYKVLNKKMNPENILR